MAPILTGGDLASLSRSAGLCMCVCDLTSVEERAARSMMSETREASCAPSSCFRPKCDEPNSAKEKRNRIWVCGLSMAGMSGQTQEMHGRITLQGRNRPPSEQNNKKQKTQILAPPVTIPIPRLEPSALLLHASRVSSPNTHAHTKVGFGGSILCCEATDPQVWAPLSVTMPLPWHTLTLFGQVIIDFAA